jgi:MFS family permease
MTYFWAAIKDWKMWLGMVIYMGVAMPLYAFSLFLPTIVAQMGYKSTQAQLMSVPPYACAAVLTITVGYFADRTRQRGLFNIFVSLIGVAGFAMQIASQKPHVSPPVHESICRLPRNRNLAQRVFMADFPII